MSEVIIVGGGWAGCAAAVAARKLNKDVLLLERTDMLLGTGLVGGIMRNNGRFTAAEEMIAMGGGDLFEICDKNLRHTNIDFPGHRHASLYDIATTHTNVLGFLCETGVNIHFKTRIVEACTENGKINSVKDQNGKIYDGDVFIDATGTAGPVKNCTKYGNGCAMCIIRCPSFGGRVSLTDLVGIKEYSGKKNDGSEGAMSGSCKLFKESLSSELQNILNKNGVVLIPINTESFKANQSVKACQQYALKEYEENIVILDTGHAKLMSPYYPLEDLRKIPGFEGARYEDPYAGGTGNSMRFFSMAPRDDAMKVNGIENLFCCGEKAGLLVGHTEAIVTGTLAGYNTTRYIDNTELLTLPKELVTGDAVSHVREMMTTDEGLTVKFTFSGSVYFDRMKKLGLYETDTAIIRERVANIGMSDIFVKC